MATETVGYQISGINNQITDDFGADNDLEVNGGGRGWTATTTVKGRVFSAKSTSKLGAAEKLYDVVKLGHEAARIESDLDAIGEELESEGMTEGELARCVAECVTSEKPYCRCKCGGVNHGAGVGRVAEAVIGNKPCKCGCGGTTKRLFVPGHDARFHAAQKRAHRALDLAVSLDELAVIERNERLAGARAKRAAKKAAVQPDGASAKTDA